MTAAIRRAVRRPMASLCVVTFDPPLHTHVWGPSGQTDFLLSPFSTSLLTIFFFFLNVTFWGSCRHQTPIALNINHCKPNGRMNWADFYYKFYFFILCFIKHTFIHFNIVRGQLFGHETWTFPPSLVSISKYFRSSEVNLLKLTYCCQYRRSKDYKMVCWQDHQLICNFLIQTMVFPVSVAITTGESCTEGAFS